MDQITMAHRALSPVGGRTPCHVLAQPTQCYKAQDWAGVHPMILLLLVWSPPRVTLLRHNSSRSCSSHKSSIFNSRWALRNRPCLEHKLGLLSLISGLLWIKEHVQYQHLRSLLHLVLPIPKNPPEVGGHLPRPIAITVQNFHPPR